MPVRSRYWDGAQWLGYQPSPIDPPPDPEAGNTAIERYLPADTSKRRPGFYVAGSDVNEAYDWSLEGSRGSVVKPDIKGYYSLGSGSVPSTAHKTMAEAGHPIHCPVALNGGTSAVPSRGLPAPAAVVSGKGIWTYAQILAGYLDGYWSWLAAQFNAVNGLIVFSPNIEPESVSTTTGRRESFSNPLWYVDRVTLGVTAVQTILKEYADAYRYIRARLEAEGVTNVIYSMNFAALGYTSTYHNSNVYPALWPGDDVVDMLGWDPYVNNPATQSFASKLATTLSYLRGGGLASAFYSGAGVTTMPWHLPEFGATPTTDAAVISWINAVPAALASVPELRALAWFSSEGTESTTIHTLPAVRAAYAEFASNAIFDPVRGVV